MNIESKVDVIRAFLQALFAEHCPCFAEQCMISNVSQDSLTYDIVNEIAQDIQFIPPWDGSCSVIYSSQRAEKDAASIELNSKEMIQFYLDCMVNLGLLLPPQITGSKSTLSLNDKSGDDRWSDDFGFPDDKDYSDYSDDYSEEEGTIETVKRRASKLNNYLMWNGDALSWVKIMNLRHVSELPHQFVNGFPTEDDLVELVKALFWYFRKAIVDNVITSLMASMLARDASNSECIAISSGSIRLSSDYDINVYGDCSEMLGIFFEHEVQKIFGEKPGYVFDSNVYSSSFMNKIVPRRKEKWYKLHRCNKNESFYYLSYPPNKEIVFDQHVWAALKVVKTIIELEERNVPNMEQTISNLEDVTTIWDMLVDIYYTLMSVKQSSHGLLFDDKVSTGDMSLENWANHLSVINFKGSETYYTRGAFLDVVANQQICKNSNAVTLDEHIYFDSFVENLADFCLHDRKVKYLQRMIISRAHLQNILRYEADIKNVLDTFLKTEEHGSKVPTNILLENALMLCDRVIQCNMDAVKRVQRYVRELVRKPMPSMNLLGGSNNHVWCRVHKF